MIQRLKLKYGDDVEETTLLSKMMAYCSKEAHSSVEKAAMISFVKLRILEPDENCSLRGDALRQAMEEDVANGMYPFFVSTTLGTTGCCAFDNIEEIGERSRVLFFLAIFQIIRQSVFLFIYGLSSFLLFLLLLCLCQPACFGVLYLIPRPYNWSRGPQKG